MNTIRLVTLATYLVAIFISLGACAQNQGITDVSNEELEKLLGKGITLVDIRTPEEWRQTGIIKGSQTITLFDRNGRVAKDFVSKFTTAVPTDQPVALICRTGNRTRAASAMVTQQLGYKKVYNVSKGITDWIRSGKPITQL
jgi:rhodanese-related sulfurtransferase